MKKLKFHIVGLTHNDVKGREVEYAKEAEGRTICLVPDDANPFDMLAVKAYDKQLFIGYVSALEGEDVRALIIARKGRNLRTRCLGCNSKEGADEKSGLQLVVEARVDVSEQEIEQARREIYDDGIYDDWHYSGPILPIDKLTRFSDCTMMLEGVINDIISIQEQLSLNADSRAEPDADSRAELEAELRDNLEEAKERLSSFMEIQRSDYSREMTQTRNRILNNLDLIDDEEIHRMGEELYTEMGFITSSGYRERAAHSFFVEAPIAMKKKQTGTYDYKDQLDAIEQQLHAFPYSLYPTFKADPVDFLRQVFYKRVPRKKMLQLLSGIVLMIMNGRVDDVKQWGKHGNEEALQAMKTVGKKPAIGEHKEELRELVKKAVLKIAVYQKRGYYGMFLSKKVYWYPVFRLMGDWELLPSNSPQSFCTFLEELFEGKKISGPKAPLCGRDDLRQAGVAPFSNHKALEWKCLQQEELVNTQEAKFNRYCEIVDIFMGILREEAFKKGIMLDDWLKK
jgi:hypothetical protein